MEREMLTIRTGVIATVAAAAIALTSFGAAPAHARYRNGDAAAAAAIAGVFGTVGAIIAANAARDRYRAYHGPYYATPYPYYGAPVYRRYHGGPRWHGWHRRHWHR
jgi:hypothetical protein